MTSDVMVNSAAPTYRARMKLFQALLVLMIATLLGYTGLVLLGQGEGLFSTYFRDIAAVNWAGQFDLDFSCFLALSGIWLAWRHHFSTGGLVLGLLAPVLGILLVAPYLLITSLQVKGDVKALLIGKTRC